MTYAMDLLVHLSCIKLVDAVDKSTQVLMKYYIVSTILYTDMKWLNFYPSRGKYRPVWSNFINAKLRRV